MTNAGPVDQRLVLDVVPSENADRAWFTVLEPQRLVPHGGSVSFLVRIAVPAGTPPGSYWLAGRAYSADAAPEGHANRRAKEAQRLVVAHSGRRAGDRGARRGAVFPTARRRPASAIR